MTFFNFNKIGISNPLVDEDTILNDNWDMADTKLASLMGVGSLTGVEVGQEWMASGRFLVQGPSSDIAPVDIDSGWSAFTALPLLSLISARSGFTPRWRVNTLIRKVQLFGGIVYNSGASWPKGSMQQVSTNATTNNIPAAYIPVGNEHYHESAGSLATTGIAAGYHHIYLNGSNTAILRIDSRFQGDDGGGNFLMLDGIEWWY